jgi:hypothetical protein
LKILKFLALLAVIGLLLLALQTADPSLNLPNLIVGAFEGVWNFLKQVIQKFS